MLTHVDHLNHTFDFRCEHCYEHHTELPIHPDAGHITVRTDDLYITCPSCKAHGHSWEIMPFDHLTEVDTGDANAPDSLVGTVLEGGNIVVLDDRTGASHPQRQRLARLILGLQGHPHIVAAREQAKAQQG